VFVILHFVWFGLCRKLFNSVELTIVISFNWLSQLTLMFHVLILLDPKIDGFVSVLCNSIKLYLFSIFL
jgi:hypothetical protein